MRMPLLLLLGCALPLTACSTPPKSSTEPTVVDPVPHVADGGTMECNPDVLEQFNGKVADEALVKEAVAASGAKNARVVKPGMAVTMDFREDRLTINVNGKNEIERIGCN
ncbi:I78 family peptidase inhibitor [Stenotrophomonas sp. AB1(2024)]|jgi:hypothetical protein|uniref:I78 family peptidase inhibitor n=1 Tax=Stenotrophomonas sp. AB1(2024) TaxID=3132215 RepID=UPI0030B6A3BD